MMATQASSSPLMNLPPEIRNRIYEFALLLPDPICLGSRDYRKFEINPVRLHCGLLATCRAIHREASPIFYGGNQFILAKGWCGPLIPHLGRNADYIRDILVKFPAFFGEPRSYSCITNMHCFFKYYFAAFRQHLTRVEKFTCGPIRDIAEPLRCEHISLRPPTAQEVLSVLKVELGMIPTLKDITITMDKSSVTEASVLEVRKYGWKVELV